MITKKGKSLPEIDDVEFNFLLHEIEFNNLKGARAYINMLIAEVGFKQYKEGLEFSCDLFKGGKK